MKHKKTRNKDILLDLNKENSLRTESFVKDTKFSIQEDLGRYCVVGDVSKFVYKARLEKKEAQDYAGELNKNKQLTLME